MVGAALGHEGQHLPLPFAQPVEGLLRPLPAQQPTDHQGVHHAPARADAADGVGQLGDVGDAVLQHVSDALGAFVHEPHGIARLDVLREHEDAHLGMGSADLVGRLEAFVGVAGGHADVEDGNIGFALFDEAHGLLPVAGRGHDVEARFDEEPRQALPQQHAVLGQDQSHGSSAVRRRLTSPPPGGTAGGRSGAR